MKGLFVVLTALLGIAVGSNLVHSIADIPKEGKGESHRTGCPGCGRVYRLYERCAVLAALCGRRRCPSCGTVRSPRDAAVELLNALLWVLCLLVLWERGPAFVLLSMLATSAYLCLAFIDLDTTMIPDRFHIILALLGTALIFADDMHTPKEHLLGVALGGGFFAACYFLSFLLFKKEGLGWGDVKLMAASGLLLGWKSVFMAILFGAVTASVILIALSAGSGDRKKEYPFAPFLAAGAVISLLAGDRLLEMYLRLLNIG